MKNLIDSAHEILAAYVSKEYGGNTRKAAKELDIPYSTLEQWLKKERTPGLEKLSPIFEKIGVTFRSLKTEASKDVVFVSAKTVSAEEGVPPPAAEDYVAAPLVGEVGAGPGYVPEENIKSWFLAYKHLPAIMYRKNLLAVEIGEHSTSMQPTLNPKDIVLIDRDDRDVSNPGHMMLVLDPVDGSGMIKRVSIKETKDDFQIMFYSDNAAKNPPSMYSLNQDFSGDWDKAIVGRVIWAWSDVRGK